MVRVPVGLAYDEWLPEGMLTMNIPEVGTLEYCQAKLNEWEQQAEDAAKERADLLARLQKAERQLKEAVELLSTVKLYEFRGYKLWLDRRDAFLASQKDAK